MSCAESESSSAIDSENRDMESEPGVKEARDTNLDTPDFNLRAAPHQRLVSRPCLDSVEVCGAAGVLSGEARTMSGWVKSYRDIGDHWVFSDAHLFRLWTYLVHNASFAPHDYALDGGGCVHLDRGELIISERKLVDRIPKLTKHTVRTWLPELQKRGMISKRKVSHRLYVYRVVNYEKYQDVQPQNGTQNGTHPGTQVGTFADRSPTTERDKNKKGRRERRERKEEGKKVRNYSDLSVELRLVCEALQSSILAFHSTYKNLHTQTTFESAAVKWAVHLERLDSLDRRDYRRQLRVAKWLKSSDFWRKNILSAAKFRQQFDRLEGEMNRNSSGTNGVDEYRKRKGIHRVNTGYDWISRAIDEPAPIPDYGGEE